MDAIEFQQRKELEAAVSDLRVFMDLAAITLHEANTAGKQGFVLTLVLSEEGDAIAYEMYTLADKVLERHLTISYRIISVRDVIDNLKKGNLYYIKWYISRITVFTTEEAESKLRVEIVNVKGLLDKAAKSLTNWIGKAQALQRGAQHYAGTNNHQLALYTIYQNIVFLFGIGGKLVMGKGHNMTIWAQQENLNDFAPTLANLFDRDNAEDSRIADLLHKANRDFPYFGKEKVKKELVTSAYKKMQQLLKIVRDIYKEQFGYCEEKLRDYSFVAESSKLQPETTESRITRIITKYMNTAAIYCFDKRDEAVPHYYLLIFEREHKANAVHDLADIIRSKTKGQAIATLLIHDSNEIQLANGEQKTFFLNVIATGEALYKHKSFSTPSFGEQVHQRDYKQAISYLQNRNLIVNQISEWQGEYEWANYSPLKAVMLHHIVEQACLGMLKLFLGYTPNHFALSYLLELCESFAPSAGKFFPRNSAEDKRLFKILSRYSWTLRYSGDDVIDFEDMSLLQTRCNDFTDYAQEVIQKELKRIQDSTTIEPKY